MRTLKAQRAYERQSRREWLQAMADSGMTKTDAARAAGINRTTLHRMLDRFDVLWPGSAIEAQYRQCLADDLSIQQVAKRLGVNRTTVYAAEACYQIRFRGHTRPRKKVAGVETAPRVRISASPKAIARFEAAQ